MGAHRCCYGADRRAGKGKRLRLRTPRSSGDVPPFSTHRCAEGEASVHTVRTPDAGRITERTAQAARPTSPSGTGNELGTGAASRLVVGLITTEYAPRVP